MACSQIYRELLSLTTFLQVHSNWKEVSYLSWQNTYRNLKTTWHIKVKFYLWTKLVENLLHPKYLISVTAPLNKTKDNKIKENLCFLCSTISINEIKVLQNSQFDLTFSIIVTEIFIWKLNIVLWRINFFVISRRNLRSFRLAEIHLK